MTIIHRAAAPGILVVTAIPDVEFLSAEQVAETDGLGTVTSLSGSYTPHPDADYAMGIMLGVNAATAIAGGAMTLNGNAMTELVDGEAVFANNDPNIFPWGISAPQSGTLSYTRTNGVFESGQLWGASFRYVDSVGTGVISKDEIGASPATDDITPAAVGDMMVAIVGCDFSGGTGSGDGVLTASNCTERLDLMALGTSAPTNLSCGLGTLLADQTASPETIGFSHVATGDQWGVCIVPLRKATS